jgi:hypothetical protein
MYYLNPCEGVLRQSRGLKPSQGYLHNCFCFKHKRVVFVTTRFVGSGSFSRLLGLFLFLLDLDDFATFVKPAIGADRMWKAHGTAVRAGNQVPCLQSVVRAAHIAAALGMFALWMWGHSTYSLLLFVWTGTKRPPTRFSLNEAGRLYRQAKGASRKEFSLNGEKLAIKMLDVRVRGAP